MRMPSARCFAPHIPSRAPLGCLAWRPSSSSRISSKTYARPPARGRVLTVDAALIAPLLKCGDHMLELIEAVDHQTAPQPRWNAVVLREALSAYQPLQAAPAGGEIADDGRRASGRAALAYFPALRRGRVSQRHGPVVLPALPRHLGPGATGHYPDRQHSTRGRLGPGKLLPGIRDRPAFECQPHSPQRSLRFRAR